MKNLSEIIHDLDMVTKQYVDDAAAAKVDKVEGKQLSTNDFTTEEKEKLAGLSITQYSTLPTANMRTYKDIVQYVGNTTEEYTTGYFYQCQKLEVGYGWVAIDVQDIDWSNLNNYSTNMVVAKATTDDAETGIYNIKIKSLPTAYAYGGLPLDIIYDENGEAPANVLKLFAGNVVATASIKAAERTALFSGTNFYVTYNGVKKKIEVPKANSTPTNAQVGYILQDLISNAFGSNILKVGPSGMKMAFSLNDFGGGMNWTDGAPTIIIEDGDENNALIPLHIDNGSVLGFNINLPLNQLLDASVFVDGVYTLNLQSGVAANGTIFWQSESFNFLETDTIGKVFETINNSKLTIHIYYDAINNRIMIESTVGGPSGVFDLGEDWTLWNALNITETLRTDIDQYIADGGYISTGANGYFDLTSPSGQVFTDVILTTKQCYFRGIEFNFANANPNESYLIAVTTQKSEDGTYTTLENKPTLNGVEIDGDKTALDYGINDTNVYYGTEEPTAENVVMWVDPSGSDDNIEQDLNNVKGDLYSLDRYSKISIDRVRQPVDYTTNFLVDESLGTEELTPITGWTGGTAVVQTNTNGTKFAMGGNLNTTYPSINALDGNDSTYAASYSSSDTCTFTFNRATKVTKIKLKAGRCVANTPATVRELADAIIIKDAFGTICRLSNYSAIFNGIEIIIPSSRFSTTFSVQISGGSSSYRVALYSLQILEYYENPKYEDYFFKASLNIPLHSYENGKLIRITGGDLTRDEIRTDKLIPITGWTNTPGYSINQNGMVITGGDNSIYNFSAMIDGDEESQWRTNGSSSSYSVTYTFPYSIKISKMKLRCNCPSGTVITVTGIKNNGQTSILFQSNGGFDTLNEMTFDNVDYYKSYRLGWNYSSGTVFQVYEWDIVQYEGFHYEEFTNMTLNINGLGEKTIQASIKNNQNYLLLYKDGQWEVAEGFVSGRYSSGSSDATTAEIFLGFKPKYAIILNTANMGSNIAISGAGGVYPSYIPRFVTEYSTQDKLTDTGIILSLSSTGNANNYSSIYYLAFR